MSIVASLEVFNFMSNFLATLLQGEFKHYFFFNVKNLQISRLRGLSSGHGLEIWREKELVEKFPLPVGPGTVAEVCSSTTLNVQTPNWRRRLNL